MQFMMTMNDSKRGEPGIFNRIAANRLKPKRRSEAEFGCNPCGEIILRGVSGVSPDLDGGQFCNLSIAVARKDDTIDTLLTKVEAATIIGTIQSLATYFPGLRPGWKVNCEAERLLGVDITGQMDSVVAQDPQVQRQLRERAITVNMALSDGLGINRSASITCVKPSGNSSQLLDCSPGIHTRWAKFYIRNVRVSAHSPLFKVLKDVGVPMDPENGQTIESATTWVIHFPVKASNGAMTRRDVTALKQLNYWKQVKENWTEHNPSATITYQPDELLDITNWVWQNRETINGLTFLPSDDALYGQMPYVEITEEEYNKRVSEFPEIDFAKIYYYEDRDLTNAAQEVACMAGDSCEIDFVGRT
jgi:ribonucleoside-diphosphate reductase alpha chain